MSFMRWFCCATGGVKQSEEYAQPLRRGSGDSMYTRKAYEHGKPQSVVSNDQPEARERGHFFPRLFFIFRKVSTRELPLPISRNSFVSQRPHISAGSGYAAADFRRMVSIKEPSRAIHARTLSQSQSHRPVQTTLYASVRLPVEGNGVVRVSLQESHPA